MWIPKPETFHGSKDILQCYESLVAGYLEAHGAPYHWLFADSWGFCYPSIAKFGAYEPDCLYPLWRNLNLLYGVRKTLLCGADLDALAACAADGGAPVFLAVDQFDLPWVTEYGMYHHDHFLAVSGRSRDGKRVYVQDLWPVEHREWVACDAIEAAWRASGSRAFQLSPPLCGGKLAPEQEHAILTTQLKRWIHAAEGEARPGYRSGLHGIRAFAADVARIGEDSPAYAEVWFDRLRRVVDVRLLFVEFLCMLRQSRWKEAAGTDVVAAAERCVAAWQSLRRYLILSRLKRNYEPKRSAELLAGIGEREQACVREVRELIFRIEHAIPIAR